MILRRGKARVRSVSLDCKSCGLLAVLRVVVWSVPKVSRVNDLFWSNSMSNIGFL